MYLTFCIVYLTTHIMSEICITGSKMKMASGRSTNHLRILLYRKIHNNLFIDFTNKSPYIILGLKIN